jgi:hypothetical protein
MDMLSHALWADLGRRVVPENSTAQQSLLGWVLAGALIPDLAHAIPVVIWAVLGVTDGAWDVVAAYALASPGTEPAMPEWVVVTSQVLHCSFHSAVLAGLVSLLLWRGGNMKWRYLLLGWWSHILIDTFTHSANFYPMRTFYPISEWSFDGMAWNSPVFVVTNYVLLGLAYVGVFLARRYPWLFMGKQEQDGT